MGRGTHTYVKSNSASSHYVSSNWSPSVIYGVANMNKFVFIDRPFTDNLTCQTTRKNILFRFLTTTKKTNKPLCEGKSLL